MSLATLVNGSLFKTDMIPKLRHCVRGEGHAHLRVHLCSVNIFIVSC